MKFKYDIAVSFVDEDRPIVEEFVNALAENDISVFYDSWEQAQLWSKDLYQQAAQYCVIFISETYLKKAFTKHEQRSAQAKAFQQNSEYIFPIKLDDTELPELPSTIAHMDLRQTSIKEIANILLKKIGAERKLNTAEIGKLIKSENVDDRSIALSQIAIFRLKDFLDIAIDIMLNDASSNIREMAAWALDNLNDERALSAFITAIHDEKFSVRSAAGWGLVHLGKMVIPYMQEIIEKDENPDTKKMANLVLRNV